MRTGSLIMVWMCLHYCLCHGSTIGMPSLCLQDKSIYGASSFLLVFLTAVEILHVNEGDVMAAFYQWLAVCFTCNSVI